MEKQECKTSPVYYVKVVLGGSETLNYMMRVTFDALSSSPCPSVRPSVCLSHR